MTHFGAPQLQPLQFPEQPEQPEQPPQPPFARALSMERTAVSKTAARTVSTMISPITVTSLVKNYMWFTAKLFGFSLSFGV